MGILHNHTYPTFRGDPQIISLVRSVTQVNCPLNHHLNASSYYCACTDPVYANYIVYESFGGQDGQGGAPYIYTSTEESGVGHTHKIMSFVPTGHEDNIVRSGYYLGGKTTYGCDGEGARDWFSYWSSSSDELATGGSLVERDTDPAVGDGSHIHVWSPAYYYVGSGLSGIVPCVTYGHTNCIGVEQAGVIPRPYFNNSHYTDVFQVISVSMSDETPGTTSAILSGYVGETGTLQSTIMVYFQYGVGEATYDGEGNDISTYESSTTPFEWGEYGEGDYLYYTQLITGLNLNTTYHCRTVGYATGNEDICYSSPDEFTTLGTVSTVAASYIGQSYATLNGTQSDCTTVYFEYGRSSATTQETSPASATATFYRRVDGLSPRITYYFRAVGVVDDTKSYGEWLNFTTTWQPTPSTPKPAQIWIEGTKFHYIDGNGVERKATGVLV